MNHNQSSTRDTRFFGTKYQNYYFSRQVRALFGTIFQRLSGAKHWFLVLIPCLHWTNRKSSHFRLKSYLFSDIDEISEATMGTIQYSTLIDNRAQYGFRIWNSWMHLNTVDWADILHNSFKTIILLISFNFDWTHIPHELSLFRVTRTLVCTLFVHIEYIQTCQQLIHVSLTRPEWLEPDFCSK